MCRIWWVLNFLSLSKGKERIGWRTSVPTFPPFPFTSFISSSLRITQISPRAHCGSPADFPTNTTLCSFSKRWNSLGAVSSSRKRRASRRATESVAAASRSRRSADLWNDADVSLPSILVRVQHENSYCLFSWWMSVSRPQVNEDRYVIGQSTIFKHRESVLCVSFGWWWIIWKIRAHAWEELEGYWKTSFVEN